MITARPLFRALLLTFVAILALSGVTSAANLPKTSASGTFTTTSNSFNSTWTVGKNTYVNLTANLSYTGTFSGTSIVQGTIVLHPDGSANFWDTETFTGTVNGVPGTVTFFLQGSATSSGAYQGTDRIVSGTGNLINLQGGFKQIGTLGDSGPLGTYAGLIY